MLLGELVGLGVELSGFIFFHVTREQSPGYGLSGVSLQARRVIRQSFNKQALGAGRHLILIL